MIAQKEMFVKVSTGEVSETEFLEWLSDLTDEVYLSAKVASDIDLTNLKEWSNLDEKQECVWDSGYEAARRYVKMQLGV